MNSQAFLTLQMEHAPFSPSQPVWLNYSDDDLIESFKNKHRAELGTEIHEWVSIQIQLGQTVSSPRAAEKGVRTHIFTKYQSAPDYRDVLIFSLDFLPAAVFGTVKSFVNDAVGFRMNSEEKIEYSSLFWGTSDAVKFSNNELLVFDLKTGAKPAKTDQLLVYAGLYCLQHNHKPSKLKTELRIYQNNEILVNEPEPEVIQDVMDRIVHKNKVLTKFLGAK